MVQPASKVSPDGPKWSHLEPLSPILAARLVTWGVPLRIFVHFYEVFVNNRAFFLKIRGNPRKIKQIAKNAPREAKNGPAGVKSEHGRTKMGLHGATFAHFAGTSVDFYAVL